MANVILRGSERTALADSRVIGPADPSERLEVSVILRRRAAQVLRARTAALAAGNRDVSHLSREEFAAQHGADEPDLAAVRLFANRYDLRVVQEHVARRTLVLSGTVAQFRTAFSVELNEVAHPNGTYRGRTGAVHLPTELDGIVEAVLGLDNRPQAKPHFRLKSAAGSGLKPRARAGSSVSYTPVQIAGFYGFPAGTGKGQCVGIIELGGVFDRRI